MNKDKFQTKSGLLTRYAFACGYVEQYSDNQDGHLTITREHGVYHVKGFIASRHIATAYRSIAKARSYMVECKLKRVGA